MNSAVSPVLLVVHGSRMAIPPEITVQWLQMSVYTGEVSDVETQNFAISAQWKIHRRKVEYQPTCVHNYEKAGWKQMQLLPFSSIYNKREMCTKQSFWVMEIPKLSNL